MFKDSMEALRWLDINCCSCCLELIISRRSPLLLLPPVVVSETVPEDAPGMIASGAAPVAVRELSPAFANTVASPVMVDLHALTILMKKPGFGSCMQQICFVQDPDGTIWKRCFVYMIRFYDLIRYIEHRTSLQEKSLYRTKKKRLGAI